MSPREPRRGSLVRAPRVGAALARVNPIVLGLLASLVAAGVLVGIGVPGVVVGIGILALLVVD